MIAEKSHETRRNRWGGHLNHKPLFVYVIGRVAVVFVRLALLQFSVCITRAINSKYYSNPSCYKLIQHVLTLQPHDYEKR